MRASRLTSLRSKHDVCGTSVALRALYKRQDTHTHSNGLYLEHVLRMGSVLPAAHRRRGSAPQSRVATPTFYGVDTPGAFPRTPVRICTVRRPRTGPRGGRTGVPRLCWSLRGGEGVKYMFFFYKLLFQFFSCSFFFLIRRQLQARWGRTQPSDLAVQRRQATTNAVVVRMKHAVGHGTANFRTSTLRGVFCTHLY